MRTFSIVFVQTILRSVCPAVPAKNLPTTGKMAIAAVVVLFKRLRRFSVRNEKALQHNVLKINLPDIATCTHGAVIC